jgi:hypothetical protein
LTAATTASLVFFIFSLIATAAVELQTDLAEKIGVGRAQWRP